MKIVCYSTSGQPPDIQPGRTSRAWMDATPQSFACRCLPLLIANAHGWELRTDCSFTAQWNGTAGKDAIKIETHEGGGTAPISHFGSGVLTFHVKGLFQTEPGVNLWVGGPPNWPRDGIAPLTGVVETDWSPYTFTMNWLFTRAHHPVRFERGEPFCFVMPLQRGLIESVEPEFKDIGSDPDLAAQYWWWSDSRNRFNADLHVPGSDAVKAKWQKTYYQGMCPNGQEGAADHQVKLRLRSFSA